MGAFAVSGPSYDSIPIQATPAGRRAFRGNGGSCDPHRWLRHRLSDIDRQWQPESFQPARYGAALGDVSAFLDTAAIGGVMSVASSPWGSNVEVVAGERYFSASGLTCRHLTVSNGRDLPGKELACRTSKTGAATQGTWVTQRLIVGLLEDAR
ncbi:DVU3141 family protein [Cobetia marina]